MSVENDYFYMEELSKEEYDQIIEYKSMGMTIEEIAKATGFDIETISNLLCALGARFF
ncbi:MAG: hypothetical protein N4A54_13875 [Peptostreptococcaceae bacterium]|jgi:hypothetical protein|nr:hypothetical protein [Peptostreptococcaceae bacterium]